MMNERSAKLGISIELDTIQAVRVICAILESDFVFYLPEKNKQIFLHLEKYFSIKYNIGTHGIPILNCIKVDHKSPMTSINHIQRPLIFPKNVFDLCQSKWRCNRKFDFFISGLLTNKRLLVLSKWISNHTDQPARKINYDLNLIKLKNRLINKYSKVRKIGFSIEHRLRINENYRLILLSSTKGRYFPKKAWDDQYFNKMADSSFVLCPNGDYIWTYRFFEAIICGAIPIIEEFTSIYSGYHFFRLDETIDRYIYDKLEVSSNFELAKQSLTIPTSTLNQEILKVVNY